MSVLFIDRPDERKFFSEQSCYNLYRHIQIQINSPSSVSKLIRIVVESYSISMTGHFVKGRRLLPSNELKRTRGVRFSRNSPAVIIYAWFSVILFLGTWRVLTPSSSSDGVVVVSPLPKELLYHLSVSGTSCVPPTRSPAYRHLPPWLPRRTRGPRTCAPP